MLQSSVVDWQDSLLIIAGLRHLQKSHAISKHVASMVCMVVHFMAILMGFSIDVFKCRLCWKRHVPMSFSHDLMV